MSKLWSNEEASTLEALWGKRSRQEIAKLLGRTPASITGKAGQLGLGRTWELNEKVSAAVVFKSLFGYRPNNANLKKFLDKGCPYTYTITGRGKLKCINLESFWRWLEKRKDEFSFLKFEKYSLGWEPRWVDEKRKADWLVYNKQRWGL